MFPIVEVPNDVVPTLEQLGSKKKFWYEDTQLGRCLFKETRSGTGEDWAEKIAAYICEQIHIPHAEYHLALWQGKRGIVTPLLPKKTERLFLGNELLTNVIHDYETGTSRRGGNTRHTVENVLRCLSDYQPPRSAELPQGLAHAGEAFVGYLMLDALIGNTDRHHENWGCLAASNGTDVRLAPSYDHASSLGRELTDERREEMLTTRDKNRIVEAYCTSRQSRGALYEKEYDEHPLPMCDAFYLASQLFPNPANIWQAQLAALTDEVIYQGFSRVPSEFISRVGAECGVQILSYNRRRMLGS